MSECVCVVCFVCALDEDHFHISIKIFSSSGDKRKGKEKLQEFTECTAEALIIDMSIQRKK